MRKLFLYSFLFVVLCFLIPFIFAKKFEPTEVISEDKIENSTNKENTNLKASNFSKIRLLHNNTNEIEEVKLEEYLCNVVSAEIPASFEIEAIKAQAIVARTYTIYTILNNKNKHENADICDSPNCCQAWISYEERINKWSEDKKEEFWNKIEQAVNDTMGKVISYNGEIINAVYHANSGGVTEIASMVWSGKDYPYLQSVETARRRWIYTIFIRSTIFI